MATTTAAHAPAGTEVAAEHEEPNYIAVFIYLTILTGVELLVYSLALPKPVIVGMLVALALAKAVLVAMYFMHLAIERKGLWIVAGVPLVILLWGYLMIRVDPGARSWAHNPENQVVGHHEGAPDAGGLQSPSLREGESAEAPPPSGGDASQSAPAQP